MMISASLIRRGTLIHELKLSQILKQSNDLPITSEDEESDGSIRHSDSISFNENANDITETNSFFLMARIFTRSHYLGLINSKDQSPLNLKRKKLYIKRSEFDNSIIKSLTTHEDFTCSRPWNDSVSLRSSWNG
jgi:hypothetical protein